MYVQMQLIKQFLFFRPLVGLQLDGRDQDLRAHICQEKSEPTLGQLRVLMLLRKTIELV